MTSSGAAATDPNVQAIRESFGRVVYSHKTHEKAREITSRNATLVKWINIILTALTSTSIVTTIFTNQKALLYVSSILSTLTLAFIIFQLSFDPAKEAERHRSTALALWAIRENYIHLLADIASNREGIDVPARRDELTDEVKKVYELAPNTSTKAYKQAQKALKISEDMTFSNDEINAFLPDSLHL
ncbi:MAG TPA: SLATT domain-containing protein [Candidatus Saccharimonadales bacterium]|nr:SLATT domain-containing protein [Candidatus Saccharimonadales bacterium]